MWKKQMNLNTGTWRKRYFQGENSGFVNLENLTYTITIFYSNDESGNQEFEIWTGSLKEYVKRGN